MSDDGGRHWAEPAIINQSTPRTAYVGRRELARAGEAVVYAAWTDYRARKKPGDQGDERLLQPVPGWWPYLGTRGGGSHAAGGPNPLIYGHGLAAWGDRIASRGRGS